MPSTDTVQTVVGVLALAGTWWTMWRKSREASDALVRAKKADDRAEEALALAKRAFEAVDGLREIETERDRLRILEAEAPGKINAWLQGARDAARRMNNQRQMASTPLAHHRVELVTEGDLVAARKAAEHPEVERVDPPVPRLGKGFTIMIKNPFFRGRASRNDP